VKTIIEPFKIKTVEKIRMTTRQDREEILRRACFNPFLIKSDDVMIDLLTDSGTSSMSDRQWAAMVTGDEAYAGSRSFFELERKVREITGYAHVMPTHQGRAAERILFAVTTRKGDIVPNNTHFDTTRANIEFTGAAALDLMPDEGIDPDTDAPFKGNLDVGKLTALLDQEKGRVPLGMITVTNNASGGQPVSMANIRAVSEALHGRGLPFIIDACRFAENAAFIRMLEPGYAGRSLLSIAQEMFSYADGCTMSAKKDAFANIGGFIALNNDQWAEKARTLLVLTEGFPTYGGLAGRDLAAIAQGLEEILEDDYMEYRIRSTAYVGEHLAAAGVPVFNPPGGHAVYVNARKLLPHIPPEQFPGQALVVEMYLEAGIRAVEIGSVMFGKTDPASGRFVPARNELVRLAIPRRVYTQSHMDYVVEAMTELVRRKDSIRGLRFTWEAPVLRHFTSRFERL
jgi:tryptophanase